MRFCTSCGKEITSGKKYCEYCGTPAGQPANPPHPPVPSGHPFSKSADTSPNEQVRPPGRSGKTQLVAGIIVLVSVLAVIWFFGIPGLSRSPVPAPAIPAPTDIPESTPVVYTTIPGYPTEVPDPAISPKTTLAYEEKYMQSYDQVYFETHSFTGGHKEVFSQDVPSPPLYIKFNITPKMFYGEKYVDIGLPSEHIVNSSYVSPNAWFKVRVYDAGNGVLVDEQGFNKEHGIDPKQEFMIRAPGSYRIEMTGNDVVAEVRILTGKS